MTPAEIQAAAPIFHESFRQAEREGYDAVVPLGMLDIGVDGGRSAVDIPVIAPLQAMLWGHPVTSGSRHIDLFLSSAEMEPEDGDAHYSERLVRLPGSEVAAGPFREQTQPEVGCV